LLIGSHLVGNHAGFIVKEGDGYKIVLIIGETRYQSGLIRFRVTKKIKSILNHCRDALYMVRLA